MTTFSAPDAGGVLTQPVLSALRAGVLSFASPKESSQRKGDPRVGAGCAGPLRYSASRAAAELGPAGLKQSSPKAPGQPALLSASQGDPKGVSAQRANAQFRRRHSGESRNPEKSRHWTSAFAGVTGQSACALSTDGLPGPLRGAEQRRNAGGSRLAVFEPKASLASRPAFRVAQGTRQRRAPTQGWPFLWLLSFGHTKESTPASKAETQACKRKAPSTPLPQPHHSPENP